MPGFFRFQGSFCPACCITSSLLPLRSRYIRRPSTGGKCHVHLCTTSKYEDLQKTQATPVNEKVDEKQVFGMLSTGHRASRPSSHRADVVVGQVQLEYMI
eukprot:3235511-Amphidinium_carterae.1